MPKKFPPRGKLKAGRRAEKKRGKKKTKARKVFTPGHFPTPEKFNKITKFDEEREVYPSEDSSSTGRMGTSDAGSDSTDSELERAVQESRVAAEVSRYKRAREARRAAASGEPSSAGQAASGETFSAGEPSEVRQVCFVGLCELM